jgi:hypothetical protein
MFCSKCGQSLEVEAEFCPKCGKPASKLDLANSVPAEAGPIASVKNPLATPALVLGILSAFFYEFVFFQVAALMVGIFGVNRATELAKSGEAKTGKGKSIAGLVLGAVYLFAWFMLVVVGI